MARRVDKEVNCGYEILSILLIASNNVVGFKHLVTGHINLPLPEIEGMLADSIATFVITGDSISMSKHR
jgi:hypothetical protein